MTPEVIAKQHEWSQRTFGTHNDTEGNCKHIERELVEVRANPGDVYEWVDIAMLAIDGALRNGYTPEQIIDAYARKVEINIVRKWERGAPGEPIEHVRAGANKLSPVAEAIKRCDLIPTSDESYEVKARAALTAPQIRELKD